MSWLVLLRDPSDEDVIPVVEELRRRLAPSIAAQHNGKDNLSGQQDVEADEEDGEDRNDDPYGIFEPFVEHTSLQGELGEMGGPETLNT
ncbi:hypothetical protein ZWY2020_059202 [Hordeum vulgare]|nr:hypothetical protein ZWY2020_059202 [Hordeum vulgare]